AIAGGQPFFTANKNRGGDVRVYEADTGRSIRTVSLEIGPVAGLAFSPDSQRLALAFIDGNVQVMDAATGHEILNMPRAVDHGAGVAFSPDGRRLASGGGSNDGDGEVVIWDAATGQNLLHIRERGLVRSLAFSPDGGRLAAACQDGTVRVWDG